jgi:hypothetical protein
MAQNTLINGNRYSWTSISIRFTGADGQPLGDTSVGPFKEINYNTKQETGKVYGTSARPIGKTRGKNDATFSFSMYLSEWQDFVDQLYVSAQTPDSNGNSPGSAAGILDIDFTLVVSYSENNIDINSVVINGARLIEIDNSNSEGSTDAAVAKCNGTAMWISYDGTAGSSLIQVPSSLNP